MHSGASLLDGLLMMGVVVAVLGVAGGLLALVVCLPLRFFGLLPPPSPEAIREAREARRKWKEAPKVAFKVVVVVLFVLGVIVVGAGYGLWLASLPTATAVLVLILMNMPADTGRRS